MAFFIENNIPKPTKKSAKNANDGKNEQTKAAWRHDKNSPNTNVTSIPIVIENPPAVNSIPRIETSLFTPNEKFFFGLN